MTNYMYMYILKFEDFWISWSRGLQFNLGNGSNVSVVIKRKLYSPSKKIRRRLLNNHDHFYAS